MITAKGKTGSRELIKKFFEGSYPTETEKRFHLWLLDERKWEEKNEALEDMWETIPRGDPREVIGSLHDVQRKLGLPQKTVKLKSRPLAFKVAAVVIPAMLVIAGAWLYTVRTGGLQSGRIAATIEAPAGTRVTLPDNTIVEVTEGVLFYPDRFTGNERRVRLEGSGYFEVAEDPILPFIIENDLLSVRVTGTEFLLSTDNENGKFTLSLVEGKVDILIPGKEPIPLAEGKEIRYDAASGEVSIEVLPEQMADKDALTQGRLVFENATLEDILGAAAMSRGYDLTIRRMDHSSRVYNVKFINGENIEEILGVLNVLTNSSFTYIIENSNIYIE